MKKFLKNFGVSLLASLSGAALIALIGIEAALPEGSSGNGDIESSVSGTALLIGRLILLTFFSCRSI